MTWTVLSKVCSHCTLKYIRPNKIPAIGLRGPLYSVLQNVIFIPHIRPSVPLNFGTGSFNDLRTRHYDWYPRVPSFRHRKISCVASREFVLSVPLVMRTNAPPPA